MTDPAPEKRNRHTLRGTGLAMSRDAASWQGILLRGPSGAGKSDLALRLLHDLGPERCRLISDDYVNVAETPDGALLADPPVAIAGKLEVRGLGIVDKPFLSQVPIKLVVDLVPPMALDRLPEREYVDLGEGKRPIRLPLFRCAPFEASAIAKIILALEILCGPRALDGRL